MVEIQSQYPHFQNIERSDPLDHKNLAPEIPETYLKKKSPFLKDTIFPFLPTPFPLPSPLPPIPPIPHPQDEEEAVEEAHAAFDLEAEVFKYIAAQRELRVEEGRQNLKEIKLKQVYRKRLHEELDKLQEYLEKHAKTSEKLSWANSATTIALVVLSVAGFISSLVSGGYTTTIDALTAVGSAANNGVAITGQFMQLQSQEKEGLAKALQESRTLENTLVNGLLDENSHAFKHIQLLWKLANQIIKNQNRLKLSS